MRRHRFLAPVVMTAVWLFAGFVLTGEPLAVADKGTFIEMKLSRGGRFEFEDYRLRSGYMQIILKKAPGGGRAAPILQIVDFSRRFELTGKDMKVSGNSGDYDMQNFTFTGPVDFLFGGVTGTSLGLLYNVQDGDAQLTDCAMKDTGSGSSLSASSVHFNLRENRLNATGSVTFQNATVDLKSSTLLFDRGKNRLTAGLYRVTIAGVGTLEGDSLDYDLTAGTAVLNGKLNATLTPPGQAATAP
ncbi:MAG: hypothetical protein ACREJQ_06300 [bacterium]